MTLQEIQHAIDEIRAKVANYGTAHAEEDELYRAIVGSIAMGSCELPQEACRLVLTTLSIDFPRDCA